MGTPSFGVKQRQFLDAEILPTRYGCQPRGILHLITFVQNQTLAPQENRPKQPQPATTLRAIRCSRSSRSSRRSSRAARVRAALLQWRHHRQQAKGKKVRRRGGTAILRASHPRGGFLFIIHRDKVRIRPAWING